MELRVRPAFALAWARLWERDIRPDLLALAASLSARGDDHGWAGGGCTRAIGPGAGRRSGDPVRTIALWLAMGLALLAGPEVSDAQPPPKIFRIGILAGGSATSYAARI